MKNSDVSKYQLLLLQERDKLLAKSRRREDIWVVQSNDLIETVQLAGEREFAVRTLEFDAHRLAEVAAALERISHGEYGICFECDEPISPKRLAALPWAACCLACQERQDRREPAFVMQQKLAA